MITCKLNGYNLECVKAIHEIFRRVGCLDKENEFKRPCDVCIYYKLCRDIYAAVNFTDDVLVQMRKTGVKTFQTNSSKKY